MTQPEVIDLGDRLNGRCAGYAGNVAQAVDLLGQTLDQCIDIVWIGEVRLEETVHGQLRFMTIDADYPGTLEACHTCQLSADTG